MEWQPVNALPSSKETSVKVSKERSQLQETIKTRDHGLCSLKLRQIYEPAGVKQTNSSQFSFYFWVGRYNKIVNYWPSGKQWVFSPSFRVSWKQKSPVIKCLIIFCIKQWIFSSMQGNCSRANFILDCNCNICDNLIYIIFLEVYKRKQYKISSYLFL